LYDWVDGGAKDRQAGGGTSLSNKEHTILIYLQGTGRYLSSHRKEARSATQEKRPGDVDIKGVTTGRGGIQRVC
jgi:hypothetical protein